MLGVGTFRKKGEEGGRSKDGAVIRELVLLSGKMVLVDDFAGINTEGQKMLDILSWVCSVASDSFLMKRRAT